MSDSTICYAIHRRSLDGNCAELGRIAKAFLDSRGFLNRFSNCKEICVLFHDPFLKDLRIV